MIEPLEVRIAPAAVFTYIDLDGDVVTIKITNGTLADLTAPGVLNFSSADPAAPRQLLSINLSADADFEGTGLTISAKRNATLGGDGFADVGYLNATGRDLGVVSIAGDLGAIDAGNPNSRESAVKSLTVQSMGELGTSTGAPDLVSDLDGRVDKLTVKGHVREAYLVVRDSIITNTTEGTDGEATIGALVIGGSIIGGDAPLSGGFSVSDRISSVKVGGDLRGGAGTSSGNVFAVRNMGAVTIGGSIIGEGEGSGRIRTSFGLIDSVSIGGDIRGGAGPASGRVDVDDDGGKTVKFFKVGGSLIGGAGADSGSILFEGPVSTFSIAGDVRGDGANTARITFDDSVGTLTIGGSLRAGTGDFSARIGVETVKTLKIGGSLRGGGLEAGSIFASTITSATIGGSLEGGAGLGSGLIRATFGLGTIKIAGSLVGGDGENSGRVETGGAIKSITVGGSLIGGDGEGSGRIRVSDEIFKAVIAGDLRGGAGEESGAILSSDRAVSITINGSVYAGTGERSGSVASGDDIVSLTVKGSLIGLPNQRVSIVGEDNTSATATSHVVLGKITIGGRVENAEILAGYDYLTPTNGDAQIGSVTVGGDWIASSIVAGVEDGADNLFGTADDQRIVAGNTVGIPARIGSVTIKGQAFGSVAMGDAFGFVAEQIGKVKVGTVSETLVADEVDAVPLGATFDFIAREDVVGAEVLLPNLAGTPDSDGVNFVSDTVVTWVDVDGDLVTLKTTKAPGRSVGSNPVGAGIQVGFINLSAGANPAAVQGMGVTITARPQDINGDGILDGDGSVNIGRLTAFEIDLGAVKIAGDLGRLQVGDGPGGGELAGDAALKSLSVQSIGAFGTSTQAGPATLAWDIRGSVGSISVRGDLSLADIIISGTSGGTQRDNGGLGKLTIGGSLRGGATVADGGAGQIDASGKIGAVTIKGDVVGGFSDRGGRIASRDTIGAVKIGGSLVGGLGEVTGQMFAPNGIASVKIGRDLRGGSDDQAGSIDGGRSLGAVTIGGSIIGGAGEESGSVLAAGFAGSIKSVKIGGDVRGGIGEESAYIHAGQKLGAVTIGGSLIGGVGPAATDGALSATIYAGNAIASGPNTMASVTIGGDVLAGSGSGSASIGAVFGQLGNPVQLAIGKIAIKGSIIGSADTDATQSAAINSNTIKSVTVGGSMLGGAANTSGSIFTSGAVSTAKIGGSVVGGAGTSSGRFDLLTLGTLTIGRDLRGGIGNGSGEVFVNFNNAIPIGAKSITLGGSLESGPGTSASAETGKITVNSPLGSLTIKGSVWGTATDAALILARGTDMKTSPLAIGKLTIGGSAEFLDVLGGFLDETQPFNGDANIGKITVGGTWRAGDIVAGVRAGPDGKYGTIDDQPSAFGDDDELFSKIGSITIKGRALGTTAPGDHYGFVAQEIGALQVGTVKFPLGKGAGTPADIAGFAVSATGDLRVREVAMQM